jgi:hypothetical protein
VIVDPPGALARPNAPARPTRIAREQPDAGAGLGLPRKALVTFVGVDLLFLAVYAIYDIASSLFLDDRQMPVEHMRWHVGDDASYSEMFGYAKIASVVVLLGMTWRRTRAAVDLVFAGAFAILFVEDTQRVHERVGLAIAGGRGDAWELAQLGVGGAVGIVVVAACAVALVRASGEARRRGLALLATLAGIGFCGVVVDYLHTRIRGKFSGSDVLCTLFEEGGEQLFLSLAAALAIAAALGLRLFRSEENRRAGSP